ncbi:MAG: tRNA lysidine(34) synthetase TilS [Corticimicrobacter sp.]|uniref:tRNA lysidine(34) synthetase TilS n=1 Tax=Corticimicrobacter sp. TaxID=2678536 RepID=UPI0032DB6183
MESSRKSRPDTGLPAAPHKAAVPIHAGIADPALLRSIRQCLQRQPSVRHAVALSGGADSAMLALHAVSAARSLGIELSCFHIHHGLLNEADAWAAHAAQLASQLGLPFHMLHVVVPRDSGKGIEGAARQARYEGLAQLARSHGVGAILLAHHQDDQAETVLLRLLRGTGPEGMAAMAGHVVRDGVTYLRPWLDVPRQHILDVSARYAAACGWEPVQDPTNQDADYTRAAVRTLLVPVLEQRWPAWRTVLGRHARQAAETGEILAEVAEQDWQALAPAEDGLSFSLPAWRSLSSARQSLALRHWLQRLGVKLPTEARLQAWLGQLRRVTHDNQMLLEHEHIEIRCVRSRVLLQPRQAVSYDERRRMRVQLRGGGEGQVPDADRHAPDQENASATENAPGSC